MCCEYESEQNKEFLKELKRQSKLTYSLIQIYGAIEELGDIQTEKMKVLFDELISEIKRCKSDVL